MNTIRRPRKRPRVKSVNFRTLWWLLVREAYWSIASLPQLPAFGARLRRNLAKRPTWWVRRRAEEFLALWPTRRFRP